LISLSGKPDTRPTGSFDETSSDGADQDMTSEETANSSVKDYLSDYNVFPMSHMYMDDGSEDVDDSDRALLSKDRSICTTQELEMIRRERNRIHAKKTRLRKKKILQQMEAAIAALEEEVSKLRKVRLDKTVEVSPNLLTSISPILSIPSFSSKLEQSKFSFPSIKSSTGSLSNRSSDDDSSTR
jgi:hypothetical protein